MILCCGACAWLSNSTPGIYLFRRARHPLSYARFLYCLDNFKDKKTVPPRIWIFTRICNHLSVAVQSSSGNQFNQRELNNLIRDLDLSKEKSEYLASILKEKGLLGPETSCTNRNRGWKVSRLNDKTCEFSALLNIRLVNKCSAVKSCHKWPATQRESKSEEVLWK